MLATKVNDSEKIENGSVKDKGVDDQRSVDGDGRQRNGIVVLNKHADYWTDGSDHCWPNFCILQH